MNKIYIRSVFRTIRSTFSRFLAIFAIVALGVGFLAGLLSSPDDMRLSADRYYDDTGLYDLRILSTLGLTEEDLEAVRGFEGVEQVLPVKDTDLLLLSSQGDSYTARIHTLPEKDSSGVNTPVLLSGRMPEKSGECVVVVTPSIVESKDWIGETLTIDREETEEEKGLPSSLTVVGTVKSSAYLSMEREHTTVGAGTVSFIAYTLPETFSYDYYTGFYLTARGCRELNSFSKSYEDKVDALKEALEPLGEARSQLRYEEIIGEAEDELQKAQKELDDKRTDAQKELAQAEKKLTDGKRELSEKEQQLKDAKAQIDAGEAQLQENRAAYNAQIAASQQQLDEGYAQLKSFEDALQAGLEEIEKAQAQIDAGYAALDEGDRELIKAKEELDRTEAQLLALENGKQALWQAASALGLPVFDTSDRGALTLIDTLSSLSEEAAAPFASLKDGLLALEAQGLDTVSAKAALEAGKAEYEKNLLAAQQARKELDGQQKALNEKAAPVLEQQKILKAQREKLDQSKAQLQQAMAAARLEFYQAEEELEAAKAQYSDGLLKLSEGKEELKTGEKELEDGRRELDEKLEDAEEQLRDARAKTRDIEEGQWLLFTRSSNAGFSSYSSNADKISAIASVFPVFFFLVAALVVLTTMTRMVEEQRSQIGTLKALGYSSGAIAFQYLFYAALGSVLGSVFGLLIGCRLFPYIIINAYNIMYDIPAALTPFWPSYCLFSSLLMTLCALLSTLLACWSELRTVPAKLMLPKAPKAGKRIFLEYITPLWERLKFTQKVTARNLIRYKKRFFMTVIGISGCTALLVTGFGIKDSISPIVSLQYEELNRYQLMVLLKSEEALSGKELKALLSSEEVEGALPVMQNEGQVIPQKGDPGDSVSLFVPSEPDLLPDYFTFRRRSDRSPIPFDESRVIVTEKLAQRQHLKIGDTIRVKNQEGEEGSFTITDICENYVSHYLYLSPAAYEQVFHTPPEMNTVLCKLPEGFSQHQLDGLVTELLSCRDVSSAFSTTELSESFGNSIKSIDSIILVLILSAGALAFVVLYNLTNINISEREKELATIKVLGFYDREVSAYIYRETGILSLIGTALGLILGFFLHQFVVRTAEIDIVMFTRTVLPMSYVYSALLTLLFSALICLVMYRRLKGISMVESMKAPE